MDKDVDIHTTTFYCCVCFDNHPIEQHEVVINDKDHFSCIHRLCDFCYKNLLSKHCPLCQAVLPKKELTPEQEQGLIRYDNEITAEMFAGEEDDYDDSDLPSDDEDFDDEDTFYFFVMANEGVDYDNVDVVEIVNDQDGANNTLPAQNQSAGDDDNSPPTNEHVVDNVEENRSTLLDFIPMREFIDFTDELLHRNFFPSVNGNPRSGHESGGVHVPTFTIGRRNTASPSNTPDGIRGRLRGISWIEHAINRRTTTRLNYAPTEILFKNMVEDQLASRMDLHIAQRIVNVRRAGSIIMNDTDVGKFVSAMLFIRIPHEEGIILNNVRRVLNRKIKYENRKGACGICRGRLSGDYVKESDCNCKSTFCKRCRDVISLAAPQYNETWCPLIHVR